MKLLIHDKYLELVPRPTKEEYTSLKHSIILEGQKDPIVINSKGVVLDGHTRHEILTDLGKKIEYRKKDFINSDEEELYVIASNTNRRQLNAFQKIEIYYKKYLEFKEQAKDNHANSHNEKKYPIGGSAVRYATLIGVGSKRTFAGIKLIEHADPITLIKLRNGSITINQAYTGLNKVVGRKKSVKVYPALSRLMSFLPSGDKEILRSFVGRYWRDNG